MEYDDRITVAQAIALHEVFSRGQSGDDFSAFVRERVSGGADTYLLLDWAGMVVGIEPDGYTHT